MKRPAQPLAWILIGCGIMIAAPGCAENPRPPQGPPPAALDACRGQPSAAPCQFTDQGQLITGTCQMRGPDWVCVPDRAPPGDRPPPNEALKLPGTQSSETGVPPRPPQEALDACVGRSEGADCVVKTPHGPINGRCGPDRAGLACIPIDPAQRPPGAVGGTGPR